MSLSILILLFFSLYTGEHIFYIGLGIIISIIIFAAITNIWVLFDFKYLQEISPRKADKGQKAVLTIQIHNDKPFIYPIIKIRYLLPKSVLTGAVREQTLSILPFRYGEVREEFLCELRGHYPLGIVSVEVADIFGLFRFSMDMTKKYYHHLPVLSVYPRVIPLRFLPLPLTQEEGLQKNQLFKTNETAVLSDIRQYIYGDPLNKIHWKATSKLQEIQVKNYEMTTQPHTLIFLETSSPAGSDLLERRQIEAQLIETSIAIINYILNKWLPVKLVVYQNGRRELSGREPQHFPPFYEYISHIAFDNPFPMHEILRIESAAFQHRGSLILIVHEISSQLFNQISIFKQSGIYPMVFLIRHPEYISNDIIKMIENLKEQNIPSFIIYSDQRLDEALETEVPV
ncbi:MAG: DUF58 domain-containing protein [Clostridiales bacterium]|nr:DUF58 domain-containing protein [Clostridiales bacterium]